MADGLLGRLGVELYADMAKFTGDLGKATKEVDGFVSNATKGFTNAHGAIMGLAGALGVLGFAKIIDDVAKVRGELDDLADSGLGSVEALSILKQQAKLSGAEFGEVTGALSKMSRGLLGTEKETSKAGDALGRLGISARDANGNLRASADVMQDVSKALNGYQDNADKAAYAQAIFGKGGEKMLPLLKDMAEFGEINATVTSKQAAEADEYGKAQKRLEVALTGSKNAIAGAMIPAVSAFTSAFADLVKENNNANNGIKNLAKDGTLTDWGTKAAFAVGAVIDVFQILARMVKSIGETIGAFVAAAVDNFSSVGTAISQLASGKFSEAQKTMQGSSERTRVIFGSLGDNIKDIFSGEKFTDKLSAKFIEQQQKIAASGNDTRAKLDSSGLGIIEKQKEVAVKVTDYGKDIAKAYETWVKAMEAVEKQYDAVAGSFANEKQRLEFEISLLGQSKQAIAAANEVRKIDLALRKAISELPEDASSEAITRLINLADQAKKDLPALAQQLADGQEAIKAAQDEFKSMYDIVDGGFKAALNGAKSFGDYIKNGLKNALYQLVAKPFIVQITGLLTGQSGFNFGNLFSGGTGSANSANGLSGLGNLFSGFSNLATTITNGVSTGIANIFGAGNVVSNFLGGATGALQGPTLTGAALGGGAATAGSTIAGSLAAAGPYIAAALAAYQLYNTFRDKGENPKYRIGFGSQAQGYASDSVFGRQGFVYAQGNDAQNQEFRNVQRATDGLDKLLAKQMTPAQIAAATARLNGATGTEFSFPKGDPTASEQLLLDFTKIKYKSVFADLDKDFSDFIGGFTGKSEDLIKSIGEMAVVLETLSSGAIKGLTLDALKAMQLETESLAQTLTRVSNAYGNYEKLFIPQEERNKKMFDAFKKQITDLGGTLPTTRQGFRDLVDSLDLNDEKQRKLWQALIDGASVADAYYSALVDVNASVKNMTASLEDLGLTAEEISKIQVTQASSAMAAINAAMETIKQLQGFRAQNNATIASVMRQRDPQGYSTFMQGNVNTARAGLITSLSAGYTTGQRLQAAGGLRDALGAQYEYRMSEASAARDNAAAAMRLQAQAYRDLAAQTQALANSFRSVAAYGRSLGVSAYSTMSPSDQLGAAAGQYASLLSRARGGDANAAGGLASASQSYLSLAQDFYGSTGAYAQIFSQVQSDLMAFEGMADAADAAAAALLSQATTTAEAADRLASSLTPQMIDLQDKYVQELEALNTMTEAWEAEQRTILSEQSVVYVRIANASEAVRDGVGSLNQEVRNLLLATNAANAALLTALAAVVRSTTTTATATTSQANSLAAVATIGEQRKAKTVLELTQ